MSSRTRWPNMRTKASNTNLHVTSSQPWYVVHPTVGCFDEVAGSALPPSHAAAYSCVCQADIRPMRHCAPGLSCTPTHRAAAATSNIPIYHVSHWTWTPAVACADFWGCSDFNGFGWCGRSLHQVEAFFLRSPLTKTFSQLPGISIALPWVVCYVLLCYAPHTSPPAIV